MVEVAGEFSTAAQTVRLTKPRRGRTYWRDAKTPELYLVLSATGRRAWQVALSHASQGWRTLGMQVDGGMTLKTARLRVQTARKRVAEGLEPWPQPRQAGLERLAPLLMKLRSIEALKEGKPGFFRFGSRAFLHFHYGDRSINADVRISDDGWTKFEVWTRHGQKQLLDAIHAYLRT